MECPNTHEKSMCSGNISQRRRGFRSRRRSPQFREGGGTSIGIISQGRSPPAAGVFSTTTCFVSVWIHYCTTRLSLANVVVYCNVTQQPTLNSFAHQAIDRNLWLMSDWFGRAAIFDRNATYPSGSWSRGGRWAPARTYLQVRTPVCPPRPSVVRRRLISR